MIDLSSKTYQNIRQEMLGKVSASYDKRDTQPIPTAISPPAYALEGFYVDLDAVQRQACIETATGDELDEWGRIAQTTRNQASAAVRLGVFNTDVDIGSRFSTINGSRSIDFTVTATAGAGHKYQLTADTVGTIGNEYTGAILPITVILGLTSAQITDVLVPGDDEEQDDDYRERIIQALKDHPSNGNIASYRSKILEIDGVGAVQVWPTWNGGGTVKCSILGSDLLPASDVLISNVQNEIDPEPNQGLGLGYAPIGAVVTISTAETVSVDIAATLTLRRGYTLEQVQPNVQTALEKYISTVKKTWDTNVSLTEVEYAADIYLAQIVAAIVGATGVVNAVDVTINGQESDLSLPQTGKAQYIPELGSVVLS